MSDPDFTEIIAAGKRRLDENARKKQEAENARKQEKLRKQTLVREAMGGIVRPILEKAVADLQAADLEAESGNGTDKFGATRLSLRVLLPDGRRPGIIFTAMVDHDPHVSWHLEVHSSVTEPKRERVEEPSSEKFVQIVGDFLAKVLA